MVYLLLYVDDILIASKDKMEVDHIKQQLHDEFEMKGLGLTKRTLGIEITRDRNSGRPGSESPSWMLNSISLVS